MPDTISLETARRLQELGVTWPINVGDSFSEPPYRSISFLWERSNWSPSKDSILLPRLDQIMEEIERQEGVRDILFHPRLNPDSPRECTIEYFDGVIFDFGPNDTEACGRALARIMEAGG